MAGVLIIEDDSASRHLLRLMLEREMHTVWEADSPEGGGRVLEEEAAPDLMISDLWLGRSTGIELLRRLRDDPIWNGLPVILISGTPNRDVVADSLPLKPAAFLTKPYDYHRIHKAVAAALSTRWCRQHFDDPTMVVRRLSLDRERILEQSRALFATLAMLPALAAQPDDQPGKSFTELLRDVANLGMRSLEREMLRCARHELSAGEGAPLLARLAVLERLFVAHIMHNHGG